LLKPTIPLVPGRLTHAVLRSIDWFGGKFPARQDGPEHLRTGRSGEEDAYFYLRHLGYVMVARNFRSPRRRGEIDLIGWDGDTLCFIEVKTRTSHAVKPAEAAVDKHKRHELSAVAREYLRHLPPTCHCRFDVVSVYYETQSQPVFELFRNAFAMS
jgi:putative endonuclease